MRYPPFLALLFFIITPALAQTGDDYIVPGQTLLFRNTTETLNQITRTPEEKAIDSQQLQEDLQLSDREREAKEWEQENQDIDEYRYDVPEE